MRSFFRSGAEDFDALGCKADPGTEEDQRSWVQA